LAAEGHRRQLFPDLGRDKTREQLEEAKRLGSPSCAGIWLGHRRHGSATMYPKAVREQHEKTLEVVRRYKDHPNLLVWGLGNEVELDGDDPRVWKAINDSRAT
jgi:beta-galactosidase/beta-glucuronidase